MEKAAAVTTHLCVVCRFPQRSIDEIDDLGVGQVRVLLDKRAGDALTFAFTTGADPSLA
jgi:hypothetical protein